MQKYYSILEGIYVKVSKKWLASCFCWKKNPPKERKVAVNSIYFKNLVFYSSCRNKVKLSCLSSDNNFSSLYKTFSLSIPPLSLSLSLSPFCSLILQFFIESQNQVQTCSCNVSQLVERERETHDRASYGLYNLSLSLSLHLFNFIIPSWRLFTFHSLCFLSFSFHSRWFLFHWFL